MSGVKLIKEIKECMVCGEKIDARYDICSPRCRDWLDRSKLGGEDCCPCDLHCVVCCPASGAAPPWKLR